MNSQNQNFESRGVSLTPAQWERCDRLTDEYGKSLAIPSSVKPWISIARGSKRTTWNASFCLLWSR